MTMPRFTGAAALYQASGHYRTSRYNSSAQTASPIWPAEVIEIHDPWGRGPLTEPPVIIDSGPTPGGPAGDEGGPGGGDDSGEPFDDKPKHKPPKRPRFIPKFKPTVDGKCNGFVVPRDGLISIPRGTYSKLPGDIWFCSGSDGQSVKSIQCQPEGTPPTPNSPCLDGWTE